MKLISSAAAATLVLTISVAVVHAQPRVDQLQNNYSYLLPSNPSYGIAQGSIFIIKGANLASTTTGLQNVPLKTNLEGVTARVTVNGTSTDVIWYYVTPNQLGGILPSNTPVGVGTLTVSNSSGTSAPAPIRVVQSAFGTLTLDGSGTGAAAVFDANYAFLSGTNSAKPGDVIVLFGTGAGPGAGDETTEQQQVNLTAVPVTVQIGGVTAQVLYHGRTIYPGLDQMNVVVPTGVPYGCSVGVSVRSGAYDSNPTTIPVAANGGTCVSTINPSDNLTISQTEIDAWLAAGAFRTGSVGLTRQWSYAITDSPTGGALGSSLTKSDILSAGFNRVAGADLPRLFNSQIAPPTAGACTVYVGTIVNPFPNLTYTSLDAGAFVTVSGAADTQTAPRERNSVGQIGYAKTLSETGTYLQPGRYTLSGPGGPDVGSFSGSIEIAPDLVWTNRASLTTVDRAQPLTLTWSGGEPTTLVTISATSTVIQGTSVSSTSVQCYARNTDRQFTVPVSILSQLPPSGRTAAGSVSFLIRGSLAIASVGKGARVTATGIDYLTLGNQWGIAQSTEYK
ncbi:MAG TPA: hypothetical protein VER03_06210 [Bryobacteraceae bacterium]|nr:hypothetical protein [Bryobacteraceae bacterium]